MIRINAVWFECNCKHVSESVNRSLPHRNKPRARAAHSAACSTGGHPRAECSVFNPDYRIRISLLAKCVQTNTQGKCCVFQEHLLHTYVTIDHKTSHKGIFFKLRFIHNLINFPLMWFVRTIFGRDTTIWKSGIWGCKIEKITFIVVQIKFLAMYIQIKIK